MKKSILQLSGSSKQEFASYIVESINNKILSEKQDKFLTRRELSEMLAISYGTIHAWQKKGILKPYKLGNRVYFKYSDVWSQMNK